MHGRVGRTLGFASVLVIALSACGSTVRVGSSAAPPSAYDAAVSGLQNADTVHMVANLTGSNNIKVDIVWDLAHTAEKGDFSSDAKHLSLVVVDRRIYVKGPDYWNATNPNYTAKIGDHYGIVPPGHDDPAAGFGPLAIADGLVGKGASARTGETITINGAQAQALITPGATLYVAVDGKPRVLRIAQTSGDYTGTIDFTDYDAPVTIAAPAGAVDIAALGAT